MNFSKEYIKECDCGEIQGLSENLEYGNWYSNKREVRMVMTYGSLTNTNKMVREASIWLPTGDQLDEEIVKICVNKWWDYSFSFECDAEVDKYYAEIGEGNAILFANSNTNPLICKIKLLKQLLQPSLGNNAEPIEDYPDEDPREVR